MWQYNHSDALYHHGIKGQRWGVRRYQNKDGSLTTAGKKRAKTEEESVKNLSDTELRTKLNRLQMEQQYKKLTQEPSKINKGKKFVAAVLTTAATQVATKYVSQYMDGRVKATIDKIKSK